MTNYHSALPEIRVAVLIASLVVFTSGRNLAQPCVQAPAGLVSWWSGDGTANDIAGANHGTMLNGTTFAGGKVSQAFSFDGVDDAVRVADAPSLKFGPTSAFSIEGWINLPEPGRADYQPIVSKWGGGPGQFGYAVVVNGQRILFVLDQWGCCRSVLSSLTVLNANTWYHFAATSDGSTRRLYVNGALEGSMGIGVNGTISSDPLDLGLGAAFPGKLLGLIDEISIYNRTLSAGEVQAIHNAGTSGKCKPATPPPGNTEADGFVQTGSMVTPRERERVSPTLCHC